MPVAPAPTPKPTPVVVQPTPTPTPVNLCGAVLTASLTLTEDLDCTGFKGTVLTMAGPGITLDGANHKIIDPDAITIVGITANQVTVKNTDMSLNPVIPKGSVVQSGASGINLYAASDAHIENNVIQGRSGAIYINTSLVPSGDLEIIGNDLSNGGIALYLGGAYMNMPLVQRNNFSNASTAGLYFSGMNLKIQGSDKNIYSGDATGIIAGGTSLDVESIDLSNVVNNPIFTFRLSSLTVNNVDVSGAGSTAGTGLIVSEVGEAMISNLTATGREYGIGGAAAGNADKLSIMNSTFNNNEYGIFLQVFNSGSYASVVVENNSFSNESVRGLGTSVATIQSETLSNNTGDIN
ncbi:unnamed protein product [Sphagnum balticum]